MVYYLVLVLVVKSEAKRIKTLRSFKVLRQSICEDRKVRTRPTASAAVPSYPALTPDSITILSSYSRTHFSHAIVQFVQVENLGRRGFGCRRLRSSSRLSNWTVIRSPYFLYKVKRSSKFGGSLSSLMITIVRLLRDSKFLRNLSRLGRSIMALLFQVVCLFVGIFLREL